MRGALRSQRVKLVRFALNVKWACRFKVGPDFHFGSPIDQPDKGYPQRTTHPNDTISMITMLVQIILARTASNHGNFFEVPLTAPLLQICERSTSLRQMFSSSW